MSTPSSAVSAAYTARHRHVLDTRLPPLLSRVATGPPPSTLVDLGAGDGQFLWALHQRGWLGRTTYAVDLAPERVAAVEAVLPRVHGVVADTTHVAAIPDGSVDVAISSQVIEHIPDDRLLAPELARMLAPGGTFYVGSVIKGRRAWWFYRRAGTWRLDPTHVREYSDHTALVAVLRHPELVVSRVVVSPFRFPVLDLALRAAAMAGAMDPGRLNEVYRQRPRLARILRWATVRPPGYSMVEVIGFRRH